MQLNLALLTQNSISTIRIQRFSSATDAAIAQVLRQSERRHQQYERSIPTSKGNNQQQKALNAKFEEMDWELCLRRYFDCVEKWNPEPYSYDAPDGLSRRTSLRQSQTFPMLERQATNASTRSSYGDYRRGDDVDTSRFTRAPRRGSSSAMSFEWQNANQQGEPSSRTSSMQSIQSNALVLYGTSGGSGQSTAVSTPRPIRRSSITGDFHWEYIGKSSTFSLLAPLTNRWPELKDAQVDIYTQTQNMTAGEARAYAQGRLAALPVEVTDEVRRVLSLQTTPQNTSQEMITRGRPSNNPVPQRVATDAQNPRRSTSLDSAQRARCTNSARPPAISPATHRSMNATNTKAGGIQNNPVPRKPVNLQSKRSFLNALDLRPLTAISERSQRPGTSKSKVSMDRPTSRSFMQAFASRKASMSTTVLDTVLDKEVGEGRSSSGSDTLTSNKDLDVEKPPLTPIKAPPTPPKSTKSAKSQKSGLNKPLPPKPATPSMSSSAYSMSSSASRQKTRLLALFKKQGSKNLSVPPSIRSLQSQLSLNQSRESLRMSMDLLRRKDSKVTLFSVAEGMEVPFDTWLKALPYIEGRVNTPSRNA